MTMGDDLQITFFDHIRKAVVCTPNQNFDNEAYRSGVLEPYAQLEEMAKQAGGQPDDEVAEAALRLLRTIFESKQVSFDEQRSRFEEIGQKTNTQHLLSRIEKSWSTPVSRG
jgi:[acyl-carrier-protein] S-malonyltransferase